MSRFQELTTPKSHSSVANDTLARIAFEITLYHVDWDIHDIGTEAAFLGEKLMYTEWLLGMAETVLISEEDTEKYVCLLTGDMY